MDRFVALARTLKRLNYCFSVLASATNRSIVLVITFGLYACPIMKVSICTHLFVVTVSLRQAYLVQKVPTTVHTYHSAG